MCFALTYGLLKQKHLLSRWGVSRRREERSSSIIASAPDYPFQRQTVFRFIYFNDHPLSYFGKKGYAHRPIFALAVKSGSIKHLSLNVDESPVLLIIGRMAQWPGVTGCPSPGCPLFPITPFCGRLILFHYSRPTKCHVMSFGYAPFPETRRYVALRTKSLFPCHDEIETWLIDEQIDAQTRLTKQGAHRRLVRQMVVHDGVA